MRSVDRLPHLVTRQQTPEPRQHRVGKVVVERPGLTLGEVVPGPPVARAHREGVVTLVVVAIPWQVRPQHPHQPRTTP